ncbi:hypothetical protein KEM55_001650 [Ascosphaera atra]|nr:hypothetical protein KEM55_001650 [Ascosphaera atra]
MIPVLDSFRSFPGALRLEIQLGCILIEDVPTNAVGSLIQPKTWNEHFRPNHALVTPRTLFTNVLTSSGADIDYILSLKGEKRNAEKSPLFLGEPLGRLVWYEFHCKTKNNDTIIINIAENADAFVSRPQETLGSVNIHCPSNVWDAAAVVKGRFEYKRGVDLDVDRAIADFMEKLFIPEGENVCIYTRMPDGSVLHVEKAFMKRETKHKCSSSILGDVEGQSEANAETDDQGMVLLQITEVQSLVIGEFGHDRGYLRLRAKPYDSMVREQRLWYEVAVVSTVAEDALNTLQFGTCSC